MQRALIVVDDRESGGKLLSEFGSIARATGAELVVVSLLSEDAYQSDQETLQRIGEVEQTNYEQSPGEFARELADYLSNEHLTDVDYQIIGEVISDGKQADRILEIAQDEACDYVCLVGKRRSPTGKALFGDRAQQVLLNFDGYVTVRME